MPSQREWDELRRDVGRLRAEAATVLEATRARQLELDRRIEELTRLRDARRIDARRDAAVVKMAEQRRDDALVKLAENARDANPKGRDKLAVSFAKSHPDAVPLYGRDAMVCEQLGSREVYDQFCKVMAREHLDPRRNGDVRYGQRLALRECGVTLGNCSTLYAAVLLAEGMDAPVVFDEERGSKAAKAADLVLSIRPDLLEGKYGSAKSPAPEFVTAAARDSDEIVSPDEDSRIEIQSIVDQLQEETSGTKRKRLAERLFALCGEPGYGARSQGDNK